MNGNLALYRSSCPSAGRFDHQTGSGWQAHPRFKIFLAALISRSMIRPQPGQLCTLTLRSFFTTRPHPEHVCDVPLGSTSAIPRRAFAATSAILVRIRPIEASLYWFVILLERDLDLSCSTLRSSELLPRYLLRVLFRTFGALHVPGVDYGRGTCRYTACIILLQSLYPDPRHPISVPMQ